MPIQILSSFELARAMADEHGRVDYAFEVPSPVRVSYNDRIVAVPGDVVAVQGDRAGLRVSVFDAGLAVEL